MTAFGDEAGLQAILDNSAAVIFVKDREGRYVMVNEAFLRPFELARDQVLGRTASEVWPGAEVHDEAHKEVLRTGEAVTRDEVVELPEGTRTVMTVRFPLRDDDDRIDSVAVIATDVTERKAAEESLRESDLLLGTILRASPDIVTILDERGRVRAISDASAAILGYDLSDPVHDEVAALVHPDDISPAVGAYARLLRSEQGSLDIRYRVRHRDGHWITLETRAQTIVGDDGSVNGAVAVSRDVTAELEFEQQLHEALVAAEQASDAKSSFLSRMSHELRTPLNSVLGFAQLLQMEELPPERAEAVSHILQGGRHLLDLINEVLEITRIESGHLTLALRPVDVANVLREAADLTRPMAERKQVRLVVETGGLFAREVVLADRQRLLQVLLNLLSNAVKYNSAGGKVVLSAVPAGAVGTAEDEARQVRISVADDGPGIAADALERVFEPFERLGAERGPQEGTGVGLTLSRHLVEEMGGRISVASELGAGTTFTMVLDRAGAANAERGLDSGFGSRTAGTAARGARRGGALVLYVEDNLANLELVEQVMARAGDVQLVSATDGSQALQLAREMLPDIVLLDLHLPDMTGFEVLERLRGDASTRDVPVVVVTADAPALAVSPFPGGVVACLAKPIDVHELLRVVESQLARTARAI